MNLFEHGLLKYFSKEQLKKIQSIHVGIGGAGGLGSNIAIMLVRSGFKYLEILDKDMIEPSNLNRQQYFLNEIGKNKITTLKKRLLAINPQAYIKTHSVLWTPQNGLRFFKNCPIIAEAFDGKENKHSFVEFYQDKAKIIVSGNGMAGLNNKKLLRVKTMGNIYIVGDYTTDASLGNPPLAPRVTMCAAMMAQIILDYALSTR